MLYSILYNRIMFKNRACHEGSGGNGMQYAYGTKTGQIPGQCGCRTLVHTRTIIK